MFLSAEQTDIRQLAREIAQREVAPQVKAMEAGDLAALKATWAKLAEAGLTGLPFEEQYGGAGVDYLGYMLALEEIAKVSASLAVTLSVHVSVGSFPILYSGTQAQKEKYLPDLVSGKKVAAFGLTEPNAGSDAANGLSKAERNGKGYVLSGSKIFITNAQIADTFVVTARTNHVASGSGGLSAFVVERGHAGFYIEPGDKKLGLHGSDWGELRFEDCHLPDDQRLGEEGNGFKLFMECLDAGRVGIGAISLGLAEACLEASTRYATERQQFGKSLSTFQAIQFKLADMATRIEASRLLVYNAAQRKVAGLDFSYEAALAKLYASEAANFCAKEAVQIFGGYGYTKDFPVERYFRDAKAMEIVEGASQVQRLVISRKILSS